MTQPMDRDDVDREAREYWDRAVASVIEPVVRPGTADVRRARARIRKVLEAPSQSAALESFEAIYAWGYESACRAEAVFAAAQETRDLAQIDEAECAALLELAWAARFQRALSDDLDMRLGRSRRDVDAGERETPAAGGRVEEYFRRSGPGLAAYLEARGEIDLADVVRADVTRFEKLTARGEFMLVETKPADGPDLSEPPDARRVAWMSERILGIMGEPRPARAAALRALVLEMSPSDTTAAVAAVRELRELGLVRPGQAAGLLEAFLWDVYRGMAQADRELQRMYRNWPTADDDGDGQRPLSALELVRSPNPVDQELAWRLGDRLYRIKVSLLRQVGEHELANLALRERWRHATMVERSGLFDTTSNRAA